MSEKDTSLPKLYNILIIRTYLFSPTLLAISPLSSLLCWNSSAPCPLSFLSLFPLPLNNLTCDFIYNAWHLSHGLLQ